jgi:hypothetical protein
MPGTINGAEHPELIPDSTAYRLFFVVIGQNPEATPQQKELQQVRLKQAHLNAKDIQSALSVLQEFKTQYSDLTKSYNDSATAALTAGQAPDYDSFLLRRDALVQDTRNKLKQVLSPEGFARLDRLISAEKRNMKIMPRPN